MARRWARLSEWPAAAHHYQAIVSRRRATVGDRVQLAHALKESGNIDRASEAYWAAAKLYPLSLIAQRELGNFLRGRDQKDLAASAFARAWVLDPQSTSLRAEISDLGVADDAAFDDLLLRGILGGEDVAAQRRDPVTMALAGWKVRRARQHARMGRWKAAELAYRAALRRDAYGEGARVQLGHAVREQGMIEEALHQYRLALLATPRDPDIYLHVGHALKAIGRLESALAAYLMAWRLKPGCLIAAREVRHIRPEISEAWLFRGAHALPSEAMFGVSATLPDPADSGSPDWRSALTVAAVSSELKPTFDFFAGVLSHKG